MNRGIWILRGAVALVAVSAFVAIWGGWVGLGRLAGFGPVDLLPGVPGGPYEVDLSITLPLGVEAFAAIALYVAVSGMVEGGARTFAWAAAIGSLGLGMFGQAAYHLLTAQEHGAGATPTWVVVFVSVLPVLVLGLASLLLHLAEAGARQSLALGVAGAVPALTEPDDDGPWNGPGNSSGNGEQEPVEPWLDDVEFARLVAGLELPSVPEAQEQERERGTGSRSGMGAGNGEPSREQEPLLENEERGTGNGERGPEPFRNEEQERGTGNGEPLLSDGEPVPQERERGTGNGLRAVPDSAEQGAGNEEPRSPRPRRNRSGNGVENGSGTGNGQRRNVRGVPDTEVAAEVVDLVGRGELAADVPVRDLTARYVMGNGRACRVRSLVLELLASERSEAVFPAA